MPIRPYCWSLPLASCTILLDSRFIGYTTISGGVENPAPPSFYLFVFHGLIIDLLFPCVNLIDVFHKMVMPGNKSSL